MNRFFQTWKIDKTCPIDFARGIDTDSSSPEDPWQHPRDLDGGASFV
jgi:hypothetical protein